MRHFSTIRTNNIKSFFLCWHLKRCSFILLLYPFFTALFFTTLIIIPIRSPVHFSLGSNDVILYSSFPLPFPVLVVGGSVFPTPRIVFSDFRTWRIFWFRFFSYFPRNVISTIFPRLKKNRIGIGGIRTADLLSVKLQLYPIDHDALPGSSFIYFEQSKIVRRLFHFYSLSVQGRFHKG